MYGNCTERKVYLTSLRKHLNVTLRNKVPIQQTKQESCDSGQTETIARFGTEGVCSYPPLHTHTHTHALQCWSCIYLDWENGTFPACSRSPPLEITTRLQVLISSWNMLKPQNKSQKQGNISRTSPSICVLTSAKTLAAKKAIICYDRSPTVPLWGILIDRAHWGIFLL